MLFGPSVQRPGGGKMQVFLQAALDDASRRIPHAQFYRGQGLDSFLDCLRQAIAARGVPTRLYLDNATIYRSPQLARIAASIGILIVHTPPYQPEGSGRIERFFRSVREQFPGSLDPRTPLSLDRLNGQLRHWLDTGYHRHEHSALQTRCCVGSETSLKCANCLRPPICAACSSIAPTAWCAAIPPSCCTAVLFEAPPHLAGKKIEVRFDPFDLTHLEIYADGKPEGVAHPVDAVVNGRTYRQCGNRSFGFRKTPFSDNPDGKQLFASAAWKQVKTRLEFLIRHPGAGLRTGEVGAGKSTAARVYTSSLNPNLHKVLYVHFSSGSALDQLRQVAMALDLGPAHARGGPADLRRHRASQPKQEAASHSHVR